MKQFYAPVILLALILTFAACGKDEDSADPSGQTNQYSKAGTFKLYMNDSLIRDGNTDEVGMAQGLDGQYVNTVTLNNGTILTMMLSGFSKTIGEDIVLNDGGDDEAIVTIGGWDIFRDDREEMYFSQSGTISRTSATRISFEGLCTEMLNSNDTIKFSGYYESESFQMIN